MAGYDARVLLPVPPVVIVLIVYAPCVVLICVPPVYNIGIVMNHNANAIASKYNVLKDFALLSFSRTLKTKIEKMIADANTNMNNANTLSSP